MKTAIIILLGILIITAGGFCNENTGHYTTPVKSAINPGASNGGTDDDTTIFHETFENGMGEWTTVDLTIQENRWHPDLFNAYNGNSWWCGDSTPGGTAYMGYDNFWLQYMDTPPMDLSWTSSPVLTFQVFWSVESHLNVPPLPPYDGWDGFNVWISTNGGGSFQVINPVNPAYDCNSLSSFGTVWGFGPNIAGWADQSIGWRAAEFNLQPYIGSNVVVRFAFCSDRAVASSTGHPELIGVFVDDVMVTDNTTVIYSNNGDDPPVGGDFTFEQGSPFGDWWEMTESTSYSPTHCMKVDDDNFYINDALVSPLIPLPDNFTLWFKYAVLCNLPDSTHGTSTSLRDYYFVDISDDGGETWEQQFYDYARGYCFSHWGICAPDTPYTGNMEMDLSGWGGDTIQIRFRCVTDGDHISGNGAGLHIDDVWVIGNNMLANDVGADLLYIPFPTTIGHQIDCSVKLHNYGLSNQSQVPAFFVAGTYAFPLAPWVAIPADTFHLFEFNWTPDELGDLQPYVYTFMNGDQNTTNDSAFAGMIEVLGDNMYELGYDNRESIYAYEFDMGEGPLVKLSPPFTTSLWWTLTNIKAMFNGNLPGATDITVHFYYEGTATQPGDEFRTEDFTIQPSSTYPNWWEEELGYAPQVSNFNGDVWVWIEITDAMNFPQPIGHNRIWGEGRYYNYDGATASEYSDDLQIRLFVTEGAVGVEDMPQTQPYQFRLAQNYPNPFNSQTTIRYQLPATSEVSLIVYDITGREVVSLVSGKQSAGEHKVVWDAEGIASGVYFIRLAADEGQSMVKKVMLVK